MLSIGLIIMVSLNVMMLFYHFDAWIKPNTGFWSAFHNRFEISGFDPFTYIMLSKWRPLYVISRHPLLSFMVWPLSILNEVLKSALNVNCAIFLVAALWTFLALVSWLLMFRIMRKLLELSFSSSVLLTAWFFSFSHVLLVTFTPDHMTITLTLLLLTIYLVGKAVKANSVIPLWQSLVLWFISTGVTTTNLVKIGLADFFMLWGRSPWRKIFLHFVAYIFPLALIGAIYVFQLDTTEAEEHRSVEQQMRKKAAKDPEWGKQWEREKAQRKAVHARQLVNLSFVTSTEHHIDRVPSLVENIFGEGFILHEDYALKDANQSRPVLVTYRHWWYYVLEAITILLFAGGVWCGRHSRLMWMTFSMFVFDMLLHVGLQFANADAYIMTAHWAFVVPIAVGFLLKTVDKRSPQLHTCLQGALLFLCVFQWVHNMMIIVPHILHL